MSSRSIIIVPDHKEARIFVFSLPSSFLSGFSLTLPRPPGLEASLPGKKLQLASCDGVEPLIVSSPLGRPSVRPSSSTAGVHRPIASYQHCWRSVQRPPLALVERATVAAKAKTSAPAGSARRRRARCPDQGRAPGRREESAGSGLQTSSFAVGRRR